MFKKLLALRESREEGFTLIEIMIVVIIIGVIASIAVPISLDQRKAAKRAEIKYGVRNAQIEINTMLIKHPKSQFVVLTAPTVEEEAGKVAWGNLMFRWFDQGDHYIQITGEVDKPFHAINEAAWNHYAVSGYQFENGNVDWIYIFHSTTGKYEEIYDPFK